MISYSDPSKNVADPPSIEELLEVLEPMRIERERKQAIRDGLAPVSSSLSPTNTANDKPGGGRDCFNCGQPGHISADCTEEKKPRGGGGGGACYECGEDGHQSRDCPSKPADGGRDCFNCGEPGHMSADCTEERKPRGGGGPCYGCGEEGHQSRDCPSKTGGGGGGGCFNCGEDGHFVGRPSHT
jgi:hypothetical protein